MGIITTLSRMPADHRCPNPHTDQSADWSVINFRRHGKCLWIKAYSSENAQTPRHNSQYLIFPENCLGQFEEILEEWRT